CVRPRARRAASPSTRLAIAGMLALARTDTEQTSPTLRPGRLALAAMLLAACALLPFSSSEPTNVLMLIVRLLRVSLGAAVVASLTLGAPHGFAIAVSLAARNGSAFGIKLVRFWTLALHVALVLFALEIRGIDQRGGDFLAPFALYGFAAVATIRYGMLLASGKGDLVADVRHGALAIIGAFAWMELQLRHPGANPDGVAWWLHGTLVTAFFVLRAARRRAR
ncbi:MAG TPA: hypothetical protein VG755_30600, partial [Nannocystaceae bacterium]|nr:hypothetical protein [Nannocystaceae bacterium]